ncbi:MAG TPA: type II toxin-antitoxin system HigB family toxin [Blastocatellia bacterium]|nr:type II toxin-antitoxin system HigB family toxin [Blastocatellia bacterium]
MEIISLSVIKRFIREHANARVALNAWYEIASKTTWGSFSEVKQTFRSADMYRQCVIFNIGGNKYRLIARIDYKNGILVIEQILTHAEYDKDKWKGNCEKCPD